MWLFTACKSFRLGRYTSEKTHSLAEPAKQKVGSGFSNQIFLSQTHVSVQRYIISSLIQTLPLFPSHKYDIHKLPKINYDKILIDY